MTPRTFSYATGVALTAASAVCWSLNGGLVRLTQGIDAWQIVFYRSSALLVCMCMWLAYRHGGQFASRIVHAGPNAAIAGVAIAGAGLSFMLSLFYTTVAQAIFMVGVAPFLSAILGLWILRERIPGITWIAMLIALAGMAVIFKGNSGGGNVIGTALAIYSAFCFSVYVVLLRWGHDTEMSAAIVWNALLLIAVSAFVLSVPNPFRDGYGASEFLIGWRNLLVVSTMGIVPLSLGLILFTIGSRSVPAAQLTLIALIEPMLSPLWAWLAVGELAPVWTFAGGAVILVAIIIQALFSANPKELHAHAA